ncbi:uncharacterized protein LOC128953810 [Oppia nitens]|uniref:uncharacterized protein LOC128953810 n=1 Tax=Oppia nitens TaxID=1686743 RepID=UPI0023DCDEC9|nr:uncharacterized protein LOC128953810 [Oppia nitens]
MKILVITLLLTELTVTYRCQLMQSYDYLFEPCIYQESNNTNEVICSGDGDLNLQTTFKIVDRRLPTPMKKFSRLYINNTALKILPENSFRDVTFDEIIIDGCKNLELLHEKSFTATNLITKSITFRNNQKLSNISVFDILSKFINLEEIYFFNNNIKHIPDEAFKPVIGPQVKLEFIQFYGKTIESIGNNPFAHLNNLKLLDISHTSIKTIGEKAFEFNTVSDNYLTIYLFGNNLLNETSFSVNSLSNIKRPVILEIEFMGKSWENPVYYREDILLPFLQSNPQNNLSMPFTPYIDCQDCRNYWLIIHQQCQQQLNHTLICNNRNQFNDPGNFIDCTV